MHELAMKKLGLELPSSEEEINDPKEADKRICDAFGKIRTQIWGKKELPSHTANIDYGFARNLYGVRWLWWILTMLCLGVSVLVPLVSQQSLPILNILILAALVVVIPVLEWRIVKPHVYHCASRYAEHAWEYLESM